MTSETFTILAHRALLFGPDRAAENTLPAISAALGERFPIEFDITIDEQGERLVLSHDVVPWSAQREPRDLLALPAPPAPHALNVKDLCALPEILDLLERHDARSRFFLFDFELVADGRRGARYLMRSVQERGFAIAHRVSEREPYAREYAADASRLDDLARRVRARDAARGRCPAARRGGQALPLRLA